MVVHGICHSVQFTGTTQCSFSRFGVDFVPAIQIRLVAVDAISQQITSLLSSRNVSLT